MKGMNSMLKHTIMRRIYYAYALAFALHPLTLHIGALAISGYLFARLVHVAVVYQGLVNVRLGDLGGHVLSVIGHADGATLAVTTLAVILGVSFLWRILRTLLVRGADRPTLVGYA